MKTLLSVLFSVLLSAFVTATPAQSQFISAPQIITPGGVLTLAHGHGTMPTLVQARLKCVNQNNGYLPGDEVIFPIGPQSTSSGDSYGLTVVPDAVNLNVKFGSHATQTLLIIGKDTGNLRALTNANWQIIFRSWVIP